MAIKVKANVSMSRKGDPGAVFTPAVSDSGIISWSNDGDLPNPDPVDVKGPKGDKGDKGDRGETGDAGRAATIAVGTVTELPVGSKPTASNSGTEHDGVIDFGFPAPRDGANGKDGPTGPTGPTGPKGDKGAQGETGRAATLAVGTVKALPAGSAPTAKNSGTEYDAVIDFGFPTPRDGVDGGTGPAGADAGFGAPISTADALPAGSAPTATVTKSGPSTATVFRFNFGIPAGATGAAGKNGVDGQDGQDGQDGKPGVIYTPAVSADGILTWTNDSGMPNPPAINIKGATGATGATGAKGATGATGAAGAAAGFGDINAEATSVAHDTAASVTISTSGPDTAKNISFVFSIPEGAQGVQGIKGDAGKDFTIYKTYASVADMQADIANVPEGDFVMIASDISDPDNASMYIRAADAFKFIADLSGSQGVPGQDGAKGDTGPAAGFGTPIISVTSLEPGNSPTATVTATGDDAAKVFTFAFGVPKGAKGDTGATGAAGKSASVKVGTVSTLAAGSAATVSNTGTGTDAVLNFGIPRGANGADGAKGDKGDTGAAGAAGADGKAATVKVGTVSTLAAGSAATVANAGTDNAAVFNFGIPRGADGATGNDGKAATIAVGKVSTLAAGSQATVKNTGTANAAVLDFAIPAGAQGGTGPAGTNGTNGSDGADGADGVGVQSSCINTSGHLIFTLTDGSTIDAGVMPSPVTTWVDATSWSSASGGYTDDLTGVWGNYCKVSSDGKRLKVGGCLHFIGSTYLFDYNYLNVAFKIPAGTIQTNSFLRIPYWIRDPSDYKYYQGGLATISTSTYNNNVDITIQRTFLNGNNLSWPATDELIFVLADTEFPLD